MDKWIIYAFDMYNTPKIRRIEVEALDIQSAMSMATGLDLNTIICIKMKMPIDSED